MARFLLCLLIGLLPLTARADPAGAEAFAREAAKLQTQVEALLESVDTGSTVTPDEAFQREAAAFSVTAKTLGAWNDAQSGPMDLGCIFRGLGDDTARQMKALIGAPSPDAQRAALKRLHTGFEDAALIGDDAAKTWRKAGLGVTGEEMLVPCTGDPSALFE